MANLSDQIAQIEEDLAYHQSRCNELEEENTRLKDEISDLEDQVAALEERIEWVHEVHPSLEEAYDVKQRLDKAT
jgi:peptidoglycan hydrolase CwlO-like protein